MSHQGSSSDQVADNPPFSQGQGSRTMTIKHLWGPPLPTCGSLLSPQPQCCAPKPTRAGDHLCPGDCPLHRTGERIGALLVPWITLNTPRRVVLAQGQSCCLAWCLAKQRPRQHPCMVQAGRSRWKKMCPVSTVFAVSPFPLSPHREVYARLRSAPRAGSRLVGGHSRGCRVTSM